MGSVNLPSVRKSSFTSSDGSVSFAYSDTSATEGQMNVTISGGTTVGKTLTAQSGGALSPIGGNWNIFASVNPAGTNPLRTIGSGNTISVVGQYAQAIAATDATKVGLSAYKSSDFSIDINGFVSLSGDVGRFFTTNNGLDVYPIAGKWFFWGSTQPAGSQPVYTVGNVGLGAIQTLVQISQAIAATDATKIGLCAFDSASFGVDANGFVTFTGSSSISLTADSGGTAIGTSFTLAGSGSTTTVRSGTTITTQLTGLTNHALLVGAGTSTITKVGPTATAGQVLQSAGAAADPAFSTATYPSTCLL